jgi:hypothetical protein
MKQADSLWAFAARLRDRGHPCLHALLQAAAAEGVAVTPDEVWAASARLRNPEPVCPPLVTGFVRDLLHGEAIENLLDPWVGLGTLLRPVVEDHACSFVGLYPRQEVLDSAAIILPPAASGTYVHGDLDHVDLIGRRSFDALVTCPAFGMPPRPAVVGGVEVLDDAGHVLFLRALEWLQPEGVGVLVGVPGRLLKSRQKGLLAHVGRLGWHLDALIQVPEGTWRPSTSASTSVAVFRHGPAPSEVFVGEVPPPGRRRSTLLRNYARRTAGKEPQLGALVRLDTFNGFPQLVVQTRVERRTKRLGSPQRLGDLAEIRRCAARRDDVEERPHSFFLSPIVGVKTRWGKDDLPERPREWFQIVVDSAKADSLVLGSFLDSPLGQEIKASRATGLTIQRVPTKGLPHLPVWLPSLEEQAGIQELDLRLRTLRVEVDDLQQRLWTRLDRSAEIRAEVDRLNREDTFVEWLDTLPYPLASILWTYHALKDQPLRRYLLLDWFFEALAQFLAVFLLSAARLDRSVFPDRWKAIRQTIKRGGMSLERASFGTWMTIFEGLSKAIRADVNSEPDSAMHWSRLMSCEDSVLRDALVSKELVRLLKETNHLRNRWRGHGGYVGDAEAQRREQQLHELLLSFRSLVGNRWETCLLVKPGTNRCVGGVYRYTVDKVAGVRLPFPRVKLSLNCRMEDGWLYFASPGLGTATPLRPFVHLGPAPAEEPTACYFFSNRNGDDVLLVSYHFERPAELVLEPDAAGGLLTELAELSTLT